jgi:CDP-diglyceride synthetase
VLLLLAGVSAGVALGLHLLAPRWSPARRALTAAGVAIGIPMSLAFGGFFAGAEVSEGSDYALGLLALIMLTLMLMAVVGLPAAWLTTQRLGRGASGSLPIEEVGAAEVIGDKPTA